MSIQQEEPWSQSYMSEIKFGQHSEHDAGFELQSHGQIQGFPFFLMEDEIGPHYKDYDDGGFVFLNDALQRLQHPLSEETPDDFRQRLVQHFENPERYPTRFWLRDYLHFEGEVNRHDPRWNTKYGAWSQRRNRPSEEEDYPVFRRKMALRLMTHFRKDELEYTLAYWRHNPLNDDDDPKIHGLFHHLFTKAMQDNRYNPDDTNQRAGYRLIMALLLGAADKVPWIRDYWAFNPYDHVSDPPQVGNILREIEFGSVIVRSDTEWYIGATQTTPARLFRIQMLRAYAENRRNMLLGAYWHYHKINQESPLDAGFISKLFIRKFLHQDRVQSGPDIRGEDYAREQRRKMSLKAGGEGAYPSTARARIFSP